MFRPRGFAELAGRRVGVFGLGVEGRATVAALRAVNAEIIQVDDQDLNDGVTLRTDAGGLDALLTCELVLKSPGVSRYRDEVTRLNDAGILVTSALALWLAATDRGRVIGVTGTKGKSTTVSLVTFFLRSLGHSAEPVGNFGHPPYDPQAAPTEWAVLEVSSYQAVDVRDAPGVVVVTSLGADHLDWHGSLEQYRRDKLQLTRAEGHHLTVIPDDPELLLHRDLLGGLLEIETGADEQLATALGLVGYHNARNVSLALRAVSLALHRPFAEIRDAALRHAAEFAPLPGRLTLVRRVGRHSYVDDGLATNPLAAVAALNAFQGETVSLIVGGFDRGVDYQPLATAVREHDGVVHVITMSDAGERIGEVVRATSPHTVVHHAASMEDAVRLATEELPDGGVVLLSPAAPSFGVYQNWQERSEHFAAIVRQR